ncbi:class F sortase [Streptomyces yaizuensis]|uniref:Class F sortase n=1 Tax=Streptomyces yaizuensis TaxID=2989713 RepID=A0ABQ5P0A3_9ACTN|nr:class F sortase [Streptomyces sp. YSPA8]GLF96032.1 class F sortase [Streptomyces sp. YSPA8]
MYGPVRPGTRSSPRIAALITLSLFLTACGAPTGGGPPGSDDQRAGGSKTPRAFSLVRAGGQGADPVDVVELKGGADRKVTAPDGAGRIGWLATGVAPGNKGAAVLSGRVGTKDSPGPLYDLVRAAVGDQAKITHMDGTTTTFTIGRIQMISRELPTAAEAATKPDGRELRVVALTPPPKENDDEEAEAEEGTEEGAEEPMAVSEQVGLLVSATVSR